MTSTMDSVVSAKVASTFIVFALTMVFGGLPVFVMSCLKDRSAVRYRTSAFISYCNCFAGGVFLGTAMLHLLAESKSEVTEALELSNATYADYPITEVTVSGGFFLILIIEVVVLRIMHGLGGHSPHQHHGNDLDTSDNNEHTLLLKNSHGKTTQRQPDQTDELTSSGLHKEVREIIKEKPSALRVIILVLALSLHMIFEGLAIGLQENNSDVWTLLLAVSLHKCIVAFSVGLQMRQVIRSLCSFVLFLLVFSIISSLGIPVGLAISDSYKDQNLVIGLLQSVATGTFFYVTFFEILQREFSHCHNICKLCLCIVGYAIVALLKLMDKD